MFDFLSDKFSDAFKNIQGKGKITEENIDAALKEVRTALLEADVNFKVVKSFINDVKQEALGEKVIRGINPDQQFIKIVQDKLASVMGEENKEIDLNRSGTIPVMVVGLNGQGKTTFCGKLALHLKKKKSKKVILIPADNFRPAAKEQLITLAKSMEMDWFDSDLSMSPQKIGQAGLAYAKDNNYDVAILDTAGRLHVDDELMGQLADLRTAIDTENPEVLMVADAMTGQEAVNVAKVFHEKIKLDGVVLSKMDSDAKGGAALSIRHVTGVPIKYVSTGEKMKDLELFHPDRLASRILDKGDVVSLVEKAEEAIDEKEAMSMMKNLEKGKFTVNDFMKQMEMMNKLGSMGSILKMLPGMGGALKDVGDLSSAEDEMKRMKIIVQSMTKKERDNYKIVKDSHVARIARGSGNPEKSVRDFLQKFAQMEKMMGGMMQMMKGGGMPGLPGGANNGFRQQGGGNPFGAGKKKKKNKGPWGGGFFR
jgi:signal recognition particle subunit SRP54